MPIKLEIKGLGHVPSFKNNKMLTRGRLITNPKRQKWMDQCIQLIESQLNFRIPINEDGTLMGQQVLSWIACNVPLDDSRQWIPELHISSRSCDKGEEGATILIERLE